MRARGQKVYLAEVGCNNQHLVFLAGGTHKLRVLLQIGGMVLLILCAVFAFNVEAQDGRGYITRVDGEQIYLDLGSNHGIEVGMLYSVYQQLDGEKIEIAKIRVTQVMNQMSIARILSLNSGKKIGTTDRIDIIPETDDTYSQDSSQVSGRDGLNKSAPSPRAMENTTSSSRLRRMTPARDNRLTKLKKHRSAWACLGAGIASLGSAAYFKRTANNAYCKYETATNLDNAVSFRTKTQTNDMRAQITMSASLLLIGVSIYLFQRDGEVHKSERSRLTVIPPEQSINLGDKGISFHFNY